MGQSKEEIVSLVEWWLEDVAIEQITLDIEGGPPPIGDRIIGSLKISPPRINISD